MVNRELINIEPYVWVMLTDSGQSINYMLSINGVGSCGSSRTKPAAIAEILESSRLSDSRKAILKASQEIKSGDQLELF